MFKKIISVSLIIHTITLFCPDENLQESIKNATNQYEAKKKKFKNQKEELVRGNVAFEKARTLGHQSIKIAELHEQKAIEHKQLAETYKHENNDEKSKQHKDLENFHAKNAIEYTKIAIDHFNNVNQDNIVTDARYIKEQPGNPLRGAVIREAQSKLHKIKFIHEKTTEETINNVLPKAFSTMLTPDEIVEKTYSIAQSTTDQEKQFYIYDEAAQRINKALEQSITKPYEQRIKLVDQAIDLAKKSINSFKKFNQDQKLNNLSEEFDLQHNLKESLQTQDLTNEELEVVGDTYELLASLQLRKAEFLMVKAQKRNVKTKIIQVQLIEDSNDLYKEAKETMKILPPEQQKALYLKAAEEFKDRVSSRMSYYDEYEANQLVNQVAELYQLAGYPNSKEVLELEKKIQGISTIRREFNKIFHSS